MSTFASFLRRRSLWLKVWVAASLGIVWLLAMLIAGSSQAEAFTLTPL